MWGWLLNLDDLDVLILNDSKVVHQTSDPKKKEVVQTFSNDLLVPLEASQF